MSEVLEKVESAPKLSDKIRLLQENRHQPLVDLLQGVFDSRIKWLLPEGPVPYKPSKRENIEGALYSETRRLYLFVENGNTKLSQVKREFLFIELLENLDPRDAKLLEHVKDKKLPYPSINAELFRAAFPDVDLQTIALPASKDEPTEKPKKARKVKKTSHVENEAI